MSIGGNPPTAGNVPLNQNDVEVAKWKSSANATAQDVNKIVLDGTTVWTKPVFSISGSASWNRDNNKATINATVGANATSWTYQIGSGSQVTGSGTSVQVSDTSNGTKTVTLRSFKNSTQKASASTSYVVAVPSISCTATGGEEKITISISRSNHISTDKWQYKIDSGSWQTGAAIGTTSKVVTGVAAGTRSVQVRLQNSGGTVLATSASVSTTVQAGYVPPSKNLYSGSTTIGESQAVKTAELYCENILNENYKQVITVSKRGVSWTSRDDDGEWENDKYWGPMYYEWESPAGSNHWRNVRGYNGGITARSGGTAYNIGQVLSTMHPGAYSLGLNFGTLGGALRRPPRSKRIVLGSDVPESTSVESNAFTSFQQSWLSSGKSRTYDTGRWYVPEPDIWLQSGTGITKIQNVYNNLQARPVGTKLTLSDSEFQGNNSDLINYTMVMDTYGRCDDGEVEGHLAVLTVKQANGKLGLWQYRGRKDGNSSCRHLARESVNNYKAPWDNFSVSVKVYNSSNALVSQV